MRSRLIAIVSLILLAAAAPARAWCEAGCVAPAAHRDAAKPHCPTQERSDRTSLSASAFDDCPALDTARPTLTVRIDVQVAVAATFTAAPDPSATRVPSLVRPHGVTTVFERSTPLRI
jgi:hypothetical protein